MSYLNSLSGIGAGRNNPVTPNYSSAAKETEKEASTDESKKVSDKESKAAAYTKQAESAGAVYEPSKAGNKSALDMKNSLYSSQADLISKLKSDLNSQVESLKSMVVQALSGQGQAIGQAADDDSVWKFLADGKFTVSEAAKAKAKEAISEDGYWGVKQTSSRIVDFAKALAGNDSSKADKLLDAFKEGYKQATKSWGKELPEISKKTYEAVEKGFEDWKNEPAASTTQKSDASSTTVENINATLFNA